MTASSPLDAVVQALTQDQNLSRMKKLMVYTCTDIWEGDPARLAPIGLEGLVQDMLHLAPTQDDLQERLNRAVQTLSKPAEYALIANAILQIFQPLYPERAASRPPSSQVPYYSVAAQLEADPELLRMKKLLLCACRQVWENDPEVLQQVDLADLLRQMHTLTPTLASLKQVLDSIIPTLNRQTKYTLVSYKLLDAVEPLYWDNSEDEEEESTQVLTSLAFAASRAVRESSPRSLPEQFPSQIAQMTLATSAAPDSLDAPLEPQPGAVGLSQGQWSDPTVRFDLRLDVMRYANPLRAKILLVELLHPSLFSPDQDHSLLQTYELDKLLLQLVAEGQPLADLELSLDAAAHRLPDSDSYGQASRAIARALRPLYPGYIPSSLEPEPGVGKSAADQTQPLMPKSRYPWGEAGGVDENTCQIFAIASSPPAPPAIADPLPDEPYPVLTAAELAAADAPHTAIETAADLTHLDDRADEPCTAIEAPQPD